MNSNPEVCLSVVMPVYNEAAATISKGIDRVFAEPPAGEILAVDDGSMDDCVRILQDLAASRPMLVVCNHPKNLGKGAAVRTRIAPAAEDAVGIQSISIGENRFEFEPEITANGARGLSNRRSCRLLDPGRTCAKEKNSLEGRCAGALVQREVWAPPTVV